MRQTKALIYTRFSPRPEDQMENCVSSEVQERACREYAARKGYEVVGVFHDTGVSRNSLDRPGAARCIGQVKRGSVVIAYHPDRVGAPDAAAVFNIEIERAGGSLEYTEEIYNGDSPNTTFNRGLQHLFAELHRAQTSLRTSAGMQRRQANGERMTHPDRVPIGRKVHPEDPKRTVENPREVAAIRAMLELREEGMGYKRIGDELTARGFRPRRGTRWHPSVVRGVLLRESASP